MNTDYLPEWIIYLWKKLILNKDGQFDGTLRLGDFAFFNAEDRREAQRAVFQASIDTLKYAAKTKSLIDINAQFLKEHQLYFYFNPFQVFLMLSQGLSSKPVAVEMKDIHIDQVAPAISGVEFDEKVLTKIKGGEEFSIVELNNLLKADSPLLQHVSFTLKINKDNLIKKLNDYLDKYTSGTFRTPKGIYYIDPEKQQSDFLRALGLLQQKYGQKIMITSELLAKAGGWLMIDELHYRFYETLFALEKSGHIEITDLRKEEVMVTLKSNGLDHAKSLQINKNNSKLYITKENDDFRYKGKLLQLSKRADHYQVFCALYALLPNGGEIDYTKLGQEVRSRVSKAKRYDKDRLQKFLLTNLTDRNNGFMHYAEIPETEDNGKPLISVNRGIGITFNNTAG